MTFLSHNGKGKGLGDDFTRPILEFKKQETIPKTYSPSWGSAQELGKRGKNK